MAKLSDTKRDPSRRPDAKAATMRRRSQRRTKTAFATPEYLQVLMPMRVDGPVITPDYIARLNRSPLDAFNDDAPAAVAKLAAIEADSDLTGSAKRFARRDASRDLARLVQGAIAHEVAGGDTRRMARLVILTAVACLRDDLDEAARLATIANHVPAGTYLAWERTISNSETVAPAKDPVPPMMQEPVPMPAQSGGDGGEELEPVQPPAPAPMPTPGEAVPVEPDPVELEPVAAVVIPALPGEKPLFRTLQDFKAMAGVGSRWALRNWDSRAGEWGEVRYRTVATVKARQLGFVDGDATALDIAAAQGQGNFGGRSWIDFPKQGDWESVPDGLLTRFRDGSPCMMIAPAPLPVDDAPAIVQPDGETAALREMVTALGERLARLEGAAQSPAGAPTLPDVEEPESLPVPSLAQNTGDLDRYVRRVARLNAVLAGRKAQLDRREGELRFAHAKAAQLQRELDEARGESTVLPVAPSIILPVGYAA